MNACVTCDELWGPSPSARLGMTAQKSLEFSNEPLNIRYGEPGRRRDLSCQKKIDRLNKCSS